MGFALCLTPAVITPSLLPKIGAIALDCPTASGLACVSFPRREKPSRCPVGTRRKGGWAGGTPPGSGAQGPARTRA